MAAGPLRSGMMDFIAAYALEGNPDNLAFSIKNAKKDVGYYRRMAEDAGVPSFMSRDTYEALNTADQEGRGERTLHIVPDPRIRKPSGAPSSPAINAA